MNSDELTSQARCLCHGHRQDARATIIGKMAVQHTRSIIATAIFLIAITQAFAAPEESHYFGIHVIDEATSRGIPLIRARTINAVTRYTDSAGWIAFDEPGLMDREVWFEFDSDG